MAESMNFPATFDEFAEQYKIVDSKEVYTNGTELIPIFRVKQWLEDRPTADVKEVKRGHWKHLGGDEWLCTNCGEVITTEGSWEEPAKKYCNECGADMRGDTDDL